MSHGAGVLRPGTGVNIALTAAIAASLGLYLGWPVAGALAPLLRQEIWLPTALIALIFGALLASSGFTVQRVLDNPFASPSTLGVNAGALLGVVLMRLFWPDGTLWVMWGSALGGALLLGALVLGLGRWLGGGRLPLILLGMALGMGVGAIASGLLIYREDQLDGLFLWGSGQLLQTGWQPLLTLFWPALGLLLVMFLLQRPLALLLLGDEHGASLGLAVSRWRLLLLLLALLQASLVTAVAGLIGFVCLMAPQLARMLGSRTVAGALVRSMLIGALLLLWAEMGSRALLGFGYRLPTGVMTVVVGAPFFLFLLASNAGRRLAGADERGFALRGRFPGWLVLPLVALLLGSLGWWGESEPLRTLLAALAGWTLAIAGVALQTLFRNPMASPDISGISSCAVLGIALWLVWQPLAGQGILLGVSLVAALLVITLLSAGIRWQLGVTQLALLGLMISALCSTLTQILLTFGSNHASAVLLWLSGSTYQADGWLVAGLAGAALVATLLLLALGRSLDLSLLGEQLPRLLGLSLGRLRLWVLLVVGGLTAVVVACVGGIGFIGLLAPHLARLLGFSRHRQLLPVAGLMGALLLVWADGVGRSLMPPFEIAAGLVVSVLGSFYFLLLLLLGYRSAR